MLTIKEFASLCSCTTQTLRYYDRIDLLKPVRVDPQSGYRYYEKNQAIDFVKIRNLQAADFSIGEIKALNLLSDQQVHEAFERKIEEQQQKLERIREIQRSYLSEKSNMERLVQSMSGYLFHAVKDYDVLREFGLPPESGAEIVKKLKAYIERITLRHLPSEPDVHLVIDDRHICGADKAAEAFEALQDQGYDHTVLIGDENVGDDEEFTPENSETLWERHDWCFVHEFLGDIPKLEEGFDYCFFFRLSPDKYSGKIEFPMFMIAAMLDRVGSDDVVMGCSIRSSPDSKNHFALLRRMYS